MSSGVNTRPSRLRAQVAYLFGSTLVDRALGLVGSVAIARHLGAADLGRLGPAMILGALVARMTDLGVSATLQRDIARRPHDAASLLARALGFRACSAAIGFVTVLAYAVGTEGVTARAWLPILAGVGALVSSWFQMFSSLWIGSLKSEYVAIAQATYRVLYLALIGAVILAHGGTNAIMVALLAASVGQLLVSVRITRRAFFAPSMTIGLSPSLDLARDSWPIGVGSLTLMAYDRVDTLVASWFLAAPIVGNYVAAYAFYSATLTVSNPINSIAFSDFARYVSEPRALLTRFRKATVGMLALGAAVGLTLAVFASMIVTVVYGRKYDSADSCLRVLAFAVPFLFANNLGGVTLYAIGQQRATMIVTFVALAFNLAFNLVAIPAFGIRAAAWATVATELAVAIGTTLIAVTVLRRRSFEPVAAAGGQAPVAG